MLTSEKPFNQSLIVKKLCIVNIATKNVTV